MGFSRPVAAVGCGRGPTPGALALEIAVFDRWRDRGFTPLGIYNCRRIAGSTSWSLHAEGRALDVGVTGADAVSVGELLEQLLAAGDGFLQRIIFNHRVYDAASPTGRAFTGTNPHTDHMHIELSWPGASLLIQPALQEGSDMTPAEVAVVVRQVLNEGTGNGQRSWAETSAATLGQSNALMVELRSLRALVQAQLDAG